MTIDPSAPLGTALQSLKAQQQTSVESLARVLNLKVGETVNGSVIQASQTTPETRQTLLQAYLQQQSKAPTTGARANNPAISEQVALLQSAKLQLVKLQVGPQQLLTFTEIPVKPQQQVQLQLNANNALTLIRATSENGNANVTPRTGSADAPPILKQALRSVLPNHAPIHNLEQGRQLSDSLQASLLLNQLTQKLGSYSAQTLVPKTLQDALKTVAIHLRTPEQLSQPHTLKQALQNSGVQLEARLKQLGQTPAPTSKSASAAMPTTTATSGRPVTAANPSLPVQDIKAALLQLLQRTQGDGRGSQATTQSPSPNPLNPASQAQANTLITLLKTLLQGAPQLTQVKQEIPREALIQQLQQLVQQALNKIQYQQLQSLSRRLQGAQDGAAMSGSHWQIEMPLRYGNEVYPLHLQFEEQWVHRKEEQEKSNSKSEEEPSKQRKWIVRLSFELPDAGFFHAHLHIINEAINASLWAENPVTLKKAQSQLTTLQQRLSKAGVEVKSLDCFPGKPNQQDNRLSYSLVDIKT